MKFLSTPPVDGLMCEYAVLEASQCFPVPDTLSLAEAAMLEPFQVSVHAANLVGTRRARRWRWWARGRSGWGASRWPARAARPG